MAVRPQFSLCWMFVVSAIVGLLTAEGGVFGPKLALAVGSTISLLSCAALVAGIVYAQGRTRAFCFGALAIFVARLKILPSEMPGMRDPGDMSLTEALFPLTRSWFAAVDANSYGIEFCLLWVFAIAGGLVAIFVRRLTLDKSPSEPH